MNTKKLAELTSTDALRGRLVIICAAAVLFVGGCGGGGGGAGGTGTTGPQVTGTGMAASSGPGDVQNLVPTSSGSSWLYDTTDPSTGLTGFQFLSVTGVRPVSGVTATVFSSTSTLPGVAPRDQYLYSNGGGVTYLGSNSAGSIDNQLAPYVELSFPTNAGPVSHVIGTNLPAGTDASGNPITANVDQQIVNAGVETLTLTAGVFPNAVKVVATANIVLRDAALNQSVNRLGTDATWFAPGVGLVQEVTTVDGVSQKWAIRGYVIGGVAHGFESPHQISTSVSPQYSGLLPQSATGQNTTLSLLVSGGATTGYLTDASGSLLQALSLPGSGYSTIAFDGTNYLIASPGRNGSGFSILGIQRVTPAGVTLDPAPGNVVLTSSSGASYSPIGVAVGGRHVLAIYELSDGANFPSLYCVLANTDGSPLNSTPILLHTGAKGYFGSVAFDGTNFLVAWRGASGGSTGDQVEAVRVSQAGGVLDSAPIPLSSGVSLTSAPAVAFDGTNFLVVWADAVVAPAAMSGNHYQIWGTRIAPGGTVLDGSPNSGGIAISSTAGHNLQSPVVAFNGSEYLIAWSDLGTCCNQYQEIRGVRLTKTGSINSGANFEMSVGSHATNGPFLAAASGGMAQFGWLSDSTFMTEVAHPF